jgi:hypothetical protein
MRTYHKKYRTTHVEAIKGRNAAHYAANREAVKASKRAYYAANRETIRAKQRAYYVANRETLRRKGVSKPTRPCPEKCEVCGQKSLNGRRRLSCEHDHATGRFRGWLCHACNTALGNVKDSPTILRALAAYLENPLWKAATFT